MQWYAFFIYFNQTCEDAINEYGDKVTEWYLESDYNSIITDLITKGKHADIFNIHQNKQNLAFQKMKNFFNNPDLVSFDYFESYYV